MCDIFVRIWFGKPSLAVPIGVFARKTRDFSIVPGALAVRPA